MALGGADRPGHRLFARERFRIEHTARLGQRGRRGNPGRRGQRSSVGHRRRGTVAVGPGGAQQRPPVCDLPRSTRFCESTRRNPLPAPARSSTHSPSLPPRAAIAVRCRSSAARAIARTGVAAGGVGLRGRRGHQLAAIHGTGQPLSRLRDGAGRRLACRPAGRRSDWAIASRSAHRRLADRADGQATSMRKAVLSAWRPAGLGWSPSPRVQTNSRSSSRFSACWPAVGRDQVSTRRASAGRGRARMVGQAGR